jgi:alkylhydroperoxidase family enzyme
VWGALRDLETSALPEKEKALFRFVAKVNHHSPKITGADMQPLYAVGWTDEAIYCAISVCALFNFYNRWIDASGVHAMSEEAHRTYAKRTAQHGYNRK